MKFTQIPWKRPVVKSILNPRTATPAIRLATPILPTAVLESMFCGSVFLGEGHRSADLQVLHVLTPDLRTRP